MELQNTSIYMYIYSFCMFYMHPDCFHLGNCNKKLLWWNQFQIRPPQDQGVKREYATLFDKKRMHSQPGKSGASSDDIIFRNFSTGLFRSCMATHFSDVMRGVIRSVSKFIISVETALNFPLYIACHNCMKGESMVHLWRVQSGLRLPWRLLA